MGGFLNGAGNFSIIPDDAGGNMKGSGINCWKNFAIKASFIQDFAQVRLLSMT